MYARMLAGLGEALSFSSRLRCAAELSRVKPGSVASSAWADSAQQTTSSPVRTIYRTSRSLGKGSLARARLRQSEQRRASGLAERGLGFLSRQLRAAHDVREAGLLLDRRDPGVAHERVPARIAPVHGPAEDLRGFRHAEPRGLRADEEDLLGVEGPVEVLEHSRAARLGQLEEIAHRLDPLPHYGRLKVVGRGHFFPGLEGLLPATEREKREGPRRHTALSVIQLELTLELAELPERVHDARGQVRIQALRLAMSGERGF